jgi:methylamine--corrinoid protein Co-methyltransferase
MRNAGRLIDILDRMENGPVTSERDFDMKMIAARTKELVKEYGITFDKVNLVNTDDGMADRCFEAGLNLAEEAGLFCTSNGRRLTWTRREILDTIKWAPTSVVIGAGHDAHREYRRSPEDPAPPTIIGGPIGQPMPEDLFVPMMQSYIQEPIIDTVITGTLETVYGREPRTKSPWEILAGWREAELVLLAARLAGREGIAVGSVQNAASDIPELSATSYGGFRQTDWHHVALVSELKTNYELLNKLTHIVRTDSIVHSFCNPIYGGMAGGSEGVAVVTVAGTLLLQMAYMTTTHSQCPTHPFNLADTAPEILWSISLSCQALTRNTPFMLDVLTSPVGGPCTKTLLYESAAVAATATASGAARLMGVRSVVGKLPGHSSGLEARFNGEVGHAVAGLSREQVNEIVKQIAPKYKDLLNTDQKGVRFDQGTYNLRTLRPTPEWQQMYDEVKDELFQIGIPFK